MTKARYKDSRRLRPAVEALEDRCLPALNPTGLEQEMLELVNRMRLNPAAELGRLVDRLNPIHSPDTDVNSALLFFQVNGALLANQWSSLTAAPPLAWSEALLASGRGHSQQMIAHDDQDHQFVGELDLAGRVSSAGYQGATSLAENIFAFADSVLYGHAAFAIDWGFNDGGLQNPAGHRLNLMNANFREIGIGILRENNASTDVGPLVITQDFGNRAGLGNPYLLGVTFADLNGNGFYNVGEALAGITVEARSATGVFTTTTLAAGGYQMQLPPGTYTVTFAGTVLGAPVVRTVTIGTTNKKLDLIDSRDGRIDGIQFNDRNRNGKRDGGEPGLAGWVVYLDANNNGARDPGERVTSTDPNGLYQFTGLSRATYVVRSLGRPGWNFIAPASGARSVNLLTTPVSTGIHFALATDYVWVPGGTGYFFDQDGDLVVVRLKHAGQLGVQLSDADGDNKGPIARILVTDTRPNLSRLVVTVIPTSTSNGMVDIGAITGSGLKAINAGAADLVGAGVNLAGYLGTLILRDIRNGADVKALGNPRQLSHVFAQVIGASTVLDFGSSLENLVVWSFGNGAVKAPRLGLLNVTGNSSRGIAGNFLADLTLTGSPDPAQATLRLASIAAGVIDAAWKINGRVGVIRLGQLKGSTLFLGFTPDSASNPMAGGTFSGNFKLATLRVRSLAGSTEPAFVNSVVAAPRLGTVSVQSVATANAGKSFGFLAGASIASLVVGDPFLKYNSQDQVFADFQVRLL